MNDFYAGLEEEETAEFEDIDIDKFCSIPACIYDNMPESVSHLLLQLHTNWQSFYINAGAAPNLFVILEEKKDEGYLLLRICNCSLEK